MKTTTKTKPDPRREAAAALDAAQAAARKPAEAAGPLNLTPAEAAALARAAFGLAGFTDATPDEYAGRAAQLAEAIGAADDTTRQHFTRALLFAASAEWCKANNPKAAKDTAGRAAAAFRLADQGRADAVDAVPGAAPTN